MTGFADGKAGYRVRCPLPSFSSSPSHEQSRYPSRQALHQALPRDTHTHTHVHTHADENESSRIAYTCACAGQSRVLMKTREEEERERGEKRGRRALPVGCDSRCF